jgi:hypothetical protein
VYDRLGVHKQALVSKNFTAKMALKSLVDLPDEMEINTFTDREAAMEWCRE